jgi:arginase
VLDLRAVRDGEWALPFTPYWLHVDADVLAIEAVDSPAPGGMAFEELSALLRRLRPGAIGAQVTVFDPDLDLDGSVARALTDCLVEGLST